VREADDEIALLAQQGNRPTVTCPPSIGFVTLTVFSPRKLI
jgi:hypothetical protein